MKAFVKNFPDIKKLSGNVTKHMTLIEELQRQVKTKNLLDISEVEQELACVEDHEKACKSISMYFYEICLFLVFIKRNVTNLKKMPCFQIQKSLHQSSLS